MLAAQGLAAGWRSARRRLRRHRRLTATLLLAAAAGVTAQSVAADPAPGTPVTVLARDLPAGHVLTPADLAQVSLPPDVVPHGVLTTNEASGQPLAAAGRQGEPVTNARLAGRHRLAAAPPGTVAMNVPLSATGSLPELQPGDAVRVVAGSSPGDALAGVESRPAEVLVERAVVLHEVEQAGSGLMSGTPGGTAVLLALTTTEALRVADAADRRWLGVVILP